MKISIKTWQLIIHVWFVLRFIVPLYIFINPIAGEILSIFLDSPDGYFSFMAKKSWRWYHAHDKLADYWWYMLIVIYGYVAHLPILGVLVVLFLYRTIGQIITLKKKESWMLIFFPNILENYFIAYLILGYSILIAPANLYVWIVCITVAFVREYLLHIKKAYAANYLFQLKVNWNQNKM